MSGHRALWMRLQRAAIECSPALNLAACVAMLIGGLVELATLHYSEPVPLAVASCTLCTLAPALGRRLPATSALLAITAMATYQGLTDDPNGDFVTVATLFACYYHGRDHPGRGSVRRDLGVVGVALPAFLVAVSSDHDNAASALGPWLALVIAPIVVGRIVARRQRLVTHLEQAAEALRLDQHRVADAATALERARVARELHDVVAHHVSVMVIQAGAARTVCTANPDAGRAALEAVESAGRRALGELRRVLGALRRGPDDAPDSAVDLVQLHELCESVRGAGVSATLTAADLGELPPEVAQATYRIVQEALTNIARHAPGARATVMIRTDETEVEIVVDDDGGRTSHAAGSLPSGGHGLVGMAERASWVGGTVAAGPQPGRGFRVAARLPVRPPVTVPEDAARRPPWLTSADTALPGYRDREATQRWLDPTAAVLFSVLLGVDAGLRATGAARIPSIGLGVLVGALVVWRRRRPMTYLVATLAGLLGLTLISPDVSADPVFGGFGLVVPTYSLASQLPRGRAAIGFAIWTAGAAAHSAPDHKSIGRFVGALAMAVAVFTVGRVIRSQRTLASELDIRNIALAAQRDNRTRVAVINERLRIARDLNVLIAQTITAMVVQARTAQQLAGVDRAGAYAEAGEVERSGREVLTQMRRVLGVLRADRSVPLQPPPEVDTTAAMPTSLAPA